ncbi:hypothetical protein GZH47_22170 [Paenibacillus rhizovicinus]|uniref:Uncharacterized protein n=1 Tax=Paenibacillus rhizovicinus TaxID=2704463 RepID=A0A6C0P3W8_9BACL|nr:hypothetical protein [Paenibacillus rhizovicinus]QHW33224.1 hypothetical protein GZH47_22170 [Paenibacillus rhizovicinus]
MGIYEGFKIRKDAGEILKIEELSTDILKTMFIDEEISDYMISKLFDVKESKISYQRKKHGITIRNSILDDLLLAKSEDSREKNIAVKKQLLVEQNITMISKAITHFTLGMNQ